MTKQLSAIALSLLLSSTAAYANSISTIQQINNNADRIAAQAQTNITQQQQILAQRLQALSTAMQAQIPNAPLQQPVAVPSPAPIQPVIAAPVATPPQTTKAQPTVTQQPNITGLAPAPQNNDVNNPNQWNYGF